MRRRRYTKWAGHFRPHTPAEWIAESHVTCNIQCLNGRCKHVVDVRLDTLPQGPAMVTHRVVSRVHRMRRGRLGEHLPNWHDMDGRAMQFAAG